MRRGLQLLKLLNGNAGGVCKSHVRHTSEIIFMYVLLKVACLHRSRSSSGIIAGHCLGFALLEVVKKYLVSKLGSIFTAALIKIILR